MLCTDGCHMHSANNVGQMFAVVFSCRDILATWKPNRWESLSDAVWGVRVLLPWQKVRKDWRQYVA